jgi:outer membrane receptor protein involved in Fe transport
MRKSCRFLSAWLVSALFSIAAYAQTSTIKGTVRNSTSKEVVPAVSVVIKGTNQGTFTNANGEFTLNVTKLPVTLVFTSVNYDSAEVNVTDANTTLEVDFVPNTTLGQEVVVAASRVPQRILEAPVTVERLAGASLRNIAAPSYYEAITNLKGVDMHTASLTFRTVTTRGFVSSGNTRLNQLIDGMDNQAPGLNFSVGNVVGLTELDVDNIEILSGASSALYGSGGMNGTVLITSKNPFKYQGISYNIRQGIMHVDGKQRKAAPYYDWAFRWGKAFTSKWAIKLAGQLTKGSDWQAEDYRNKQQVGVLSQVVGGNRFNDPNYNGINVYGDEASTTMAGFAGIVTAQTRQGILGATTLDVVSLLNSYYGAIGNPVYPTNAQVTGFYNFAGFPAQVIAVINNPAIKPLIDNMLPFYNGVRAGYFGNQSVSRTGYEEEFLVDYNTLNVKGTAGLHYKINDNIEASINSYFGTGTTVYTGADRYSLRNLKIGQHKLEVKARNWFIRGYTTQENAGESYNATALGVFINSAWKSNATWFGQYVGTFAEGRRLNQGAVSDIQLHTAARNAADVGRLLPGTPAFEAAARAGRSTPIKNNGALFLDKSDLWASEGQVNVSDAVGFTEMVEVIAGVQWKQWVMNSQGTLFADNTDSIGYTKVPFRGNIKVNETGGYVQLRKRLFDELLTLTGAIRYDKQTNYDGRWTPRLTAVIRVAKDNNIRLSFQTAYRFPTNQNQYISLITGAGALIGHLPEFQTYYQLNGIRQGYTAESIIAYRNSGNPANTNLLEEAVYKEVSPETVSSYEVGYRGILGKKLLVDVYGYYSQYRDFLATIGVGQSNQAVPNQQHLFSSFTTGNVSYTQNTEGVVKALGWGLGLEYQLIRNFLLYGNVFSDEMRDAPENLVTFFNAPKYRVNVGLRNDNVYKGLGFNVVVKWQDNNFYEGTFVTGTLPNFAWVDAQVSYRPAGTKSLFRVGGTNLGNHYARTGFGSPYVGGLYYVSYGYNIF